MPWVGLWAGMLLYCLWSLPNGAVGWSMGCDVAIFVFFYLFLTVSWVGQWAVMLLFFSVSSNGAVGWSVGCYVAIFVFLCLFLTVPWVGL